MGIFEYAHIAVVVASPGLEKTVFPPSILHPFMEMAR
jgi:hypothetical protein